MIRSAAILLLILSLTACASVSKTARPPGEQACESFFIYVLCVADLNYDGNVDYMYFDDTRDIFMFAEAMRDDLFDVLPFHPCAIPMSRSTRETSSSLLYGDDLSLTERLALKGRLITNYRASQPAIDACYATLQEERSGSSADDAPFLTEDEWGDEN